MKSKGTIKFLMMMQSNCPLFQWGLQTGLPIFEQLSMNLSGFFGAFNSLVTLLQHGNLLTGEERLDNVKFGQTQIFYRDNEAFQSIYIVESLGLRNRTALLHLMDKIDQKFRDQFGPLLKNWDHNVEPFHKFKEICDRLLI